MGDRISIQFRKKADYIGMKKSKNVEYDTSIAFFSHWDGKTLIKVVNTYADGLQAWLAKEGKDTVREPLHRLQPDTVMVDFIVWFGKTQEGRITGNYYLGKDANDGDNSDNGNWVYDLDEMDWVYD